MDGSDLPQATNVSGRDAHGRFAAGNSGRPFGSRNRVSKRVARAILADFEAHQDEMLAKLRRWFAPQYVSLVARLLPRVDESGAGAELDELDAAETQGIAAAMRAALERLESGAGSLAELEAALLGERRPGPVEGEAPISTAVCGLRWGAWRGCSARRRRRLRLSALVHLAAAIPGRMTDYRLYFRGEDGRFRSIVELDCASDEEAISAVADHAEACAMELWQRHRLVKAFPEPPDAR